MIKRHTVTGLKYFCKSYVGDYLQYKGSGKHWTRHIKKHGVKYVVTDWVSEVFNDPTDIKEFGLFFSEFYNIVQSKEWANMKPEDGLTGGSAKGRPGDSRSKNCSKSQLKRFTESPDTEITKKRKSTAHQGTYRIESPTGQIWITTTGLKEFAKENSDLITLGSLFWAYRKCYNNTSTTRKRRDLNNWKVERID